LIKVIYFLLLLMASVEDGRTHTVKPYKVILLWVLGMIHMIVAKENRWVTFALTCLCFGLLVLLYYLMLWLAGKKRREIYFGGADVRMIPAMMLIQGWDVALAGVFLGLLGTVICRLTVKREQKEIPLVPWMSAGCFLVEIFYLFSERSML